MFGGKNIRWDKTSGGTKRPEGQNVRRQNGQQDKTSVGQNVRGEKRPARKKVPFDQWEKISANVGKKRPAGKDTWQGKMSPFQTHIIRLFFRCLPSYSTV
jgi:hypothetical protein